MLTLMCPEPIRVHLNGSEQCVFAWMCSEVTRSTLMCSEPRYVHLDVFCANTYSPICVFRQHIITWMFYESTHVHVDVF